MDCLEGEIRAHLDPVPKRGWDDCPHEPILACFSPEPESFGFWSGSTPMCWELGLGLWAGGTPPPFRAWEPATH